MASVDGFRSLKGASDELKVNNCEPCKIDDVERRASHYCKDCLHYLCDHCKDYHRKIPVLKNHMSTLSAALKVLESDYKLLGDAKNDGRKKVMFAVDKQVSKNLHDCHARLSDIGNDVINTDLIFERNKRLASLQSEIYSIGSLKRNIQNDRIILLGSKIQSQKQVHVKLSDDNSKPCISGSAVMTAGEVVLCDRNNSNLKVLDSSDALIDNLKLNAEPWDISVVDARTVIVTLPWKQRLQYIDLFPRLTKGRVLQLDKLCWGVHVFSDRIFTTCQHNLREGEVRILDLDGNPLHRLGMNTDGSFLFKTPYHITVSTSEKIFVSDTDKGTVTCMTIDQHVVYQYSAREIQRPMGSYCDGGDNILVCDRELNSVQVITAEGKKHCELVSSRDGLREPRSISFREDDNTLVVGCCDSEHVFLFKLEK